MKRKVLSFSLLALLLAVSQILYAIPRYPYPGTFTQPDGQELTVQLQGDERIHWHETMDGYTLLYDSEGYLTYAYLDEDENLQPSEHIATDIEQRNMVVNSFLNTIEPKLFFSEAQKRIMLQIWQIEDDVAAENELRGPTAVTGSYKTLCALVEFPSKRYIKTKAQFEALINQLGYTANSSGSVRDYFKEVSYGQFDLTVTVCGIYTAPNEEAYYAGSNNTQRCGELARWAAQQVIAEPDINLANFGNPVNNQVGFHFIFAGVGAESVTNNTGLIWSHKSTIYPAITQNGKSINSYSCSPELVSGTTISTIGVICHEMTHVFGAADFYDVNYGTGGQYIGTGRWDLMADGSYNSNGNRPAHPNMYIKVQFGWVTPTVLSTPTVITNMPNSAENKIAYRVNTTTNNEYFLLENRQRVGFDNTSGYYGLPGIGLLIYRVHSNINGASSGINATHPQRMYPVCASATVAIPTSTPSSYGSINSAGCPFPGSSNQTSFTDNTTPSMKSWAGNNTNKPITEITNNTTNKTVSFVFMGSGPTAYTVTFMANGGTGNMNPQTFTPEVAQNLTANTFTRSGYTFNKWNTQANGGGTNYSNQQNITITGDMTLYAQWTQDPSAIEENELSKIQIYGHLQSIHIKNEIGIALRLVEIFDMTGRLVYQNTVENVETEIMLNVTTGIYTVRLSSQNNNMATKVFITN